VTLATCGTAEGNVYGVGGDIGTIRVNVRAVRIAVGRAGRK